MKKILFTIGALVLLVGAVAVWYVVTIAGRVEEAPVAADTVPPVLPTSPRDAAYNIGGVEYRFVDGAGSAVESADAPAVRIVGEPIFGDIRGAGRQDAAVLFEENGQSGKNYHLAVAVTDGVGYVGTEAVHLGTYEPMVSLTNDVFVVTARATGTDAVSSRYFSLAGIRLVETGPFPEGTVVIEGHMRRVDRTFTFFGCNGTEYAVLRTSPSFVAVEAIYMERVQSAGEQGVYMMLAGEQSGSDDLQELSISSVLSAYAKGVCSTGTASGEQPAKNAAEELGGENNASSSLPF